jgi:hypothetical protein
LRYQRYHTDADLRGLRRNMPLIGVWDDHEIVNDTWRDGAGGHDPATEGSFAARRAAAVQAYHEWMPTRTGRTRSRSTAPSTSATCCRCTCSTRASSAAMHRPTAMPTWRARRTTPARQLLGAEQEAWLAARLQESTATWQVLGQQVVFGGMRIPLSVYDDFSDDAINAFLDALDTPDASRTERAARLVAQPRIGYELTNWDGFPAARERVLAMARAATRTWWCSRATATTPGRMTCATRPAIASASSSRRRPSRRPGSRSSTRGRAPVPRRIVPADGARPEIRGDRTAWLRGRELHADGGDGRVRVREFGVREQAIRRRSGRAPCRRRRGRHGAGGRGDGYTFTLGTEEGVARDFGYKDLVGANSWSLWMPVGVPPDVLATFHKAVVKAMGNPVLKNKFTELGADPTISTPEELTRFITAESARYGEIIRAQGIKGE